jgi:Ca2+-transporting ATPase
MPAVTPIDRHANVASGWHAREVSAVVRALDSDAAAGLDDGEARRRLERHGPNELPDRAARGPWRVLIDQLASVMVAILVAAAGVSVLLGDLNDALVILAIVLLNTALGFAQEHRAERAMAALKRLAVPTVRLRRAGAVRSASAREVVPGDVVLLEAGDVVPATPGSSRRPACACRRPR